MSESYKKEHMFENYGILLNMFNHFGIMFLGPKQAGTYEKQSFTMADSWKFLKYDHLRNNNFENPKL